MTIITFEISSKPIGKILKLCDDNIIISLGNKKVSIRDIIRLMSTIMFSNMYSSDIIQISTIENLEEKILDAQIKCFYFFQYKPTSYKKKSTNTVLKKNFELVHSNSKGVLELIELNKTIAKFQNEIKNLIELPPELIYPQTLLNYILEFSNRNKLNVLDVYDENRLEKEGFGGILNVGKGSHNPPKMAIIEWPGTSNSKPIVLVGKGVTYDSGGYSIKSHMKNMKRDKTGVCLILGIMAVLAKFNCPTRVIGILPMAENVISSKSYKPDAIIHSYSKKTVEVFDTDAEGRLLLMDGISLAYHYHPKLIIDVATLTSVATFCSHYGAIFTNNYDMAWKLQKIGNNLGDNFWVLPLSNEIIKDTQNTKMANVKNDGFRCNSGTMMGAAFIANFINNDIPWLHIDIGDSESIYEKHNLNNQNSTNGFIMLLEFILNNK